MPLNHSFYLCIRHLSYSYYTPSNVIAVCLPYFPITVTINDLLQVVIAVNTRTAQCRFLGGFTGTAECQIEYSTQEDLSGSVVDTGSNSSGDTVTVTLTATLERSSTYYFLITATAPSVTVRVQGFFKTGIYKGIIVVYQ